MKGSRFASLEISSSGRTGSKCSCREIVKRDRMTILLKERKLGMCNCVILKLALTRVAMMTEIHIPPLSFIMSLFHAFEIDNDILTLQNRSGSEHIISGHKPITCLSYLDSHDHFATP
jgi:hypothetical protein